MTDPGPGKGKGKSKGKTKGKGAKPAAKKPAPKPTPKAAPAPKLAPKATPPAAPAPKSAAGGKAKPAERDSDDVVLTTTTADGTKVDGPVALRNAILSRPDAFATVLTERMMTYALGRGVEPSDMPVVRSIVKKAALNNYRLGSIVMGIVESAPFQMRTRLEPAETSNRVARVQ